MFNAINYSINGIITVTLVQNSKECIISIQDEGIGILNEELDSIFTPFNRGSNKDNTGDGTGLGLTICREIVEAHNGYIKAFNNDGVGATVEFLIPIKLNKEA